MHEPSAAVFIIECDSSVCASLRTVLAATGLNVETFESAQAFLDGFDVDRAGCLVLDIRLPGMGAVQLQQHLTAIRAIVPIVFITGHGDVPLAVEAMQNGAVDFVQKPFNDVDLIKRVGRALEKDRANRAVLAATEEIRSRLQLLSVPERQVLELLAQGRAEKLIACELGLSPRGVEIHRARVMEKMGASSLAHLVRMATEAARVTSS